MNKTLMFNDVEVTKKEFYDTKKVIPLNLVDVGNIAVSNKVKIIMKQVNISLVI